MDVAGTMPPDERRLLRWAAALTLTTVLVVTYAAAISLPALHWVPGAERSRAALSTLIHQRWDFFTADTTAEILGAASWREGRLVSFDVGSSSGLTGSAGFGRRTRTGFDEMRALEAAGTSAGAAFRPCTTDLTLCVTDTPSITVATPFHSPYLCGPVVLTRRLPERAAAAAPAPVRLMRLNVRCG